MADFIIYLLVIDMLYCLVAQQHSDWRTESTHLFTHSFTRLQVTLRVEWGVMTIP